MENLETNAVENVNEGVNDASTEQAQEPEVNTPTVEELMAELAKEKANAEKLKNALTKSNSEAADYKKALRAKQTAQEQAEEAAREAKEEHDAYVKSLEDFQRVTQTKEMYMAIGMPSELAGKMAEAVVSGDEDARAKIYKEYNDSCIKQAKAEVENEFYKNRPRVNSGVYSGMTKDDIMAIKNPTERAKAIHENIALFK